MRDERNEDMIEIKTKTDQCRCGCDAPTKSLFAIGHDARLKSILTKHAIEAGSLEAPVQVDGRTMTVLEAATQLSGRGALAEHIERAFRRQQDKPAKKARAPKLVTARVGRWAYEGTVADGIFTYRDKGGATKTATQFKLEDR